MSNTAFHERIERIQKAHAAAPAPKVSDFRAPGASGIAAARHIKKRRRHPVMEHLVSTAFGIVLGCLVAVALIGLSQEGTLWSAGSDWHAPVYYTTMAGLMLAPVLMLASLFMASRRPAFALFSLGYLSGIVVPLFL